MHRPNRHDDLPRASDTTLRWRGIVREISLRRLPANSPPLSKESGAITLGYFLRGQLCGVAHLLPLARRNRRRAEVRLSVTSDWQDCGVGTMLMAGVLEYARADGISDLYLRCHTLNGRMQRIAEKFDARLCFQDCTCLAHIEVASTASVTASC